MAPATAQWVLQVTGAGLFGLVIGSFLNVVIYRVPRKMSVVRPPSHCPTCGTQLGAVENVPLISWVLLRAKCRHCHASISPRYPLVELATGLAFLGLAWSTEVTHALPFLLVVAGSALAGGGIAADGLAVPPSIAAVAFGGAAGLAALAAASGQPGRIGWSALGGVTVAVAGAAALAATPSRPRRRQLRERWGSVLTLTALGWSASWLWAPGGVIFAGWITLVLLATHVERARSRARGIPIPVAIVTLGGLTLLVAGSLLSTRV